MWDLVLDLVIGGGGANASAALPVIPAEDEQVPLDCGPEVRDIDSIGTDFASECRT